MRKFLGLVLAFLVAGAVLTAAGDADATPDQWTNYWIVAHPDDEILEMGGGLADHMLAGYRNVVIYVTDGEGTAAIDKINDDLEAAGRDPLTPYEIGLARIREARAAIGIIGSYDIIQWHMTDGSVDTNAVEAKIDALLGTADGGVAYTQIKTHSPYESPAVHPDHQAIADAVQRLWEAGRVSNVRYYRINQLEYKPVDGASWCTYLTATEQAYKQAARAEYSKVDWDIRRYGVADASAHTLWVATETQPECVDVPR